MKNIIDIKKLETVLVNGYQTFRDGRYSYEYETLVRTLAHFGIKIDDYAMDAEIQRRYAVRRARPKPIHQRHNEMEWVFTFTGDFDVHYAALGDGDERRIDSFKITCEENGPRWRYVTYCREYAIELWRYIKRYHPDFSDLKFEVINKGVLDAGWRRHTKHQHWGDTTFKSGGGQ
jgi:hypothetical protein